MKRVTPIIISVLGCLCLMAIFPANLFSQNVPPKKNDRKVRYITNSKKALTRPRIRVVKRGTIGRSPSKTTRKLRSGDRTLEKQAFKLINDKRVEKGLAKLVWNDKLASLARQHSENMAKHSFFSHVGLNGRLIDQRAVDHGVKKWQAIGENIAYNKGFAKPADFAVERWMLSSTHRMNLLDARWKQSGIGVGITEDETYFFTQVFLVK